MPLLGTRGAASAKGFGFTASVSAPPGQQAYTTAGTYTWIAPAGVTSVSVVAVGGGGGYGFNIGGGGGGLGYKNNYPVSPGGSYTVVVGAKGTSVSSGGNSYFDSVSVVKGGGGVRGPDGGSGGTYTGDGGGNGGAAWLLQRVSIVGTNAQIGHRGVAQTHGSGGKRGCFGGAIGWRR